MDNTDIEMMFAESLCHLNSEDLREFSDAMADADSIEEKAFERKTNGRTGGNNDECN